MAQHKKKTAKRRQEGKRFYELQLGAFLQQDLLPLLHRPLLRNRDPDRGGRPREPPLLEALHSCGRQLPAQVAAVVEEAGAVGGREGEAGQLVARGGGGVGGEDEAEEVADDRRKGHAAEPRGLRARRRR